MQSVVAGVVVVHAVGQIRETHHLEVELHAVERARRRVPKLGQQPLGESNCPK